MLTIIAPSFAPWMQVLLPAAGAFSPECAGQCSFASGLEGASTAWSVSAGNMLGVILSATDPVAVVALLKELGVKVPHPSS